MIVKQFGMTLSEANHFVFYCHYAHRCFYLIVYVDGIIITRSDHHGINQVKQYLSHHLHIKDLGAPRYFMGIEVAQSKDSSIISQRKNAMDILEETGLVNA